ncbi:ribosome recycling factor [Candidatus Hodgkinia cicadicola]|uniref:Ribosome recycling factor n=1 Tax=Candidatus Hodgkinia cicadicola TaxID=573658 RepID=A0ABX4MH09_9HYPH|nr:ribosome recycling factor [Candidatus Hodgkinia cicadicola]
MFNNTSLININNKIFDLILTLKLTFVRLNSKLDLIYLQLEEMLLNIVNKFELTSSKILPSKLNLSLIKEMKVKKNIPLISLCNYNQISETTIELYPKENLKLKDIILLLHIDKSNLVIRTDGKSIKISLPIITSQRRRIVLNELSRIYEQYKKDIRTIRKNIINEVRLIKGICDDNRIYFLKRIDNSIEKSTVLLYNSFLKNKARLTT